MRDVNFCWDPGIFSGVNYFNRHWANSFAKFWLETSTNYETLENKIVQKTDYTSSHSLRLSTKIQVYRAVVVPTLLYGAETWVLYRKQIRLLQRFHKRYFRSIRCIKWQDHVSNEEVLKRASLPSIESILLQVQLRWAGHVTRLEDVRIPKAVFLTKLQEGKRDRGAPGKRHKDQLETFCTGGNQPSVMAAGGLRQRQLALISEKSQLWVRGGEA